MKIVVAVDGSDFSEVALLSYLDTVWSPTHELHLVLALEFPYISTNPFVRDELLKETFQTAKEYGERKLDEIVRLLEDRQIACTVHSSFGHPGEYIVTVASQLQAGMVVIGTRGLGKVRRTLLGSVSDYVLHHAPKGCQVFVACHSKVPHHQH